MARLMTTQGEFARRGFADPATSAQIADQLATHLAPSSCCGPDPDPAQHPTMAAWIGTDDWFNLFEAVADPDLGLATLAELVSVRPTLATELMNEPGWARRLVLVVGSSIALGQYLVQHPDRVDLLRAEPRRRSRAELIAELAEAIADQPHPRAAADTLKLANKAALVRVSARDLASLEPEAIVDDIAAELADLADAVLQAALDLARLEVPDHADTRLAVIGLGKCGAGELNYISDVDVVFVAEPSHAGVSSDDAIRLATRLASVLTRICSEHTAAGSIWQVDAGLRPEGKAGALVRSLASMQRYYQTWASNWEFQAMLKARVVAGDVEIGQRFIELVEPLVWQAAEREHFLAETQAMRQRVISLIGPKEAGREIKLSAGGLRDTEFTVQLLQLVHGRADPRLRAPATLAGLKALVDHGYIGRRDGSELSHAYRFQRVLEHRVQLYRLRRTHLLPADEPGLRRLARALSLRGGPSEVTDAWRVSALKVQRLHTRIFYSPLVDAATRVSSADLALTPEAAIDRLKLLGFSDPAAALRHIEALTNGLSRGAEIQRQLMPAMLGWFAEAPSPDAGLLAFRQVSEALGSTPWYLRTLRDQGETAHRLALILSSSRYVVELLKQDPEAVQIMADDAELQPRDRERLIAELRALVARHRATEAAIRAIRGVRRRELFRVAVADLLGLLEVTQVGRALTDVTSACVHVALEAITRLEPAAPVIGVIAMGRWGGGELSYGSDADAIFVVCDPVTQPQIGDGSAATAEPVPDGPSPTAAAVKIIAELRQVMAAPGPDPALLIDADLRPEGKGGPMVRTVSSTIAYYARWADTWEGQALVRADYGAGDRELVDQVLTAVTDLRWPPGGLSRAQWADIRKLKARMETERIPKGHDPKRNVKLGPGGLSDVEWTVQTAQMMHAGDHPDLRRPGTIDALRALETGRFIDPLDAEQLRRAWLLASRLRNAAMLTSRRANDAIPTDARELSAISHLLGHGFGQASELLEEYARVARKAARVTDRLFWGKA